MFAKADKRLVVNHSAGDFDEIDAVFHFRGNLHAPTVFSDSIRVKILYVLNAIGDARGISLAEEILFDVFALRVMTHGAHHLMAAGRGFTFSPPSHPVFSRVAWSWH